MTEPVKKNPSYLTALAFSLLIILDEERITSCELGKLSRYSVSSEEIMLWFKHREGKELFLKITKDRLEWEEWNMYGLRSGKAFSDRGGIKTEDWIAGVEEVRKLFRRFLYAKDHRGGTRDEN